MDRKFVFGQKSMFHRKFVFGEKASKNSAGPKLGRNYMFSKYLVPFFVNLQHEAFILAVSAQKRHSIDCYELQSL